MQGSLTSNISPDVIAKIYQHDVDFDADNDDNDNRKNLTEKRSLYDILWRNLIEPLRSVPDYFNCFDSA